MWTYAYTQTVHWRSSVLIVILPIAVLPMGLNCVAKWLLRQSETHAAVKRCANPVRLTAMEN